MRALGLDIGEKTIGVAGNDDLGLTAQPLTTLRRHGGERDLLAVGEIARERSAEIAVVGLPVQLDGTEGRSAKRARSFGEALKGRLPLAVVYWDESFSTVEAERALLAADVSRRRRKEVIDKLAAAVILQSWMDAGEPR